MRREPRVNVLFAKHRPVLAVLVHVEKIGLAVSADNEGAIRLYKRLGFAEEGRRPREMKLGPGQYMDDILRWLCDVYLACRPRVS